MVKAKSFKKLGILLISLISIISMAKVQVNAIRYMDGRFITNLKAISNIYMKVRDMSNNFFDPYKIERSFSIANQPQISFSIISSQGFVREILLAIPSRNTRECAYMTLKPKDQMPIINAIMFFQSESNKLDNLFTCEYVSTSQQPASMIWVRPAPADFYSTLIGIDTEAQYLQLAGFYNATIRPYELSHGEFIVIDNVEVR